MSMDTVQNFVHIKVWASKTMDGEDFGSGILPFHWVEKPQSGTKFSVK